MIICHTRTNDTFKKEVRKLYFKNGKWTRYAWYAALAGSLYAIVLCICDRSIITMMIIAPFFVLSCWNVTNILGKYVKTVRVAGQDCDTVFSEHGIFHAVLGNSNQYHFTYKQIKTASFSDKAAVIPFGKAVIAISSEGVEEGKYQLLRETLLSKTRNQTRKNNITGFLFALPVTIVVLGFAVIFSIILFMPGLGAVADRSETGVLQATSEYAVKSENAQRTSFGYVCYYSEDGMAVVYMESEPSTTPLYYARYGTTEWEINKLPAPFHTITLENGETVYTYQTDAGVFAEVRNCPSRRLIEESPTDEATTNFQPQTGVGHFFRVRNETDYCLTVSGQALTADQLCP